MTAARGRPWSQLNGGREISCPFPTSAETLEELLVYDTAEWRFTALA